MDLIMLKVLHFSTLLAYVPYYSVRYSSSSFTNKHLVSLELLREEAAKPKPHSALRYFKTQKSATNISS